MFVWCASCSYYAVFDGHGGTRASKHAAEHLHRNLKERLPKGAKLLLSTFIKVQGLKNFQALEAGHLSEQPQTAVVSF